MKKILLIYTGGTICTASDGEKRFLNSSLAKTILLEKFANSTSPLAPYTKELFEDSNFPKEFHSLSENMTVEKLDRIAKHLFSLPLDRYAGVMIMHGTDTLAFSASLFSFLFSAVSVPILFVSGNRPPMDEKSNANANFRFAAERITEGLSPGVYVPYRNSDGNMYLHRGSTVIPCANFSEDFFNASSKNVCMEGSFSQTKNNKKTIYQGETLLPDRVLLISPFPGLNYEAIPLEGIKAVVHGSYHSGTVCILPDGKNSLVNFANRCQEKAIPLFLSPSQLSPEQYDTVFKLCERTNTVLLNMVSSAAYTKAIAGVSCGLKAEKLISFMKTPIAGELID